MRARTVYNSHLHNLKMKIRAIIYYAIQWIIVIIATIAWITTDLPIGNMIMKVIILGLLVIYLIWKGIRDFKPNNMTTK